MSGSESFPLLIAKLEGLNQTQCSHCRVLSKSFRVCCARHRAALPPGFVASKKRRNERVNVGNINKEVVYSCTAGHI